MAFSTVFRCSFRPEVFNGVLFGTVDRDVSVDVWANFGDSRLKIRLNPQSKRLVRLTLI